MFLFFQLSVGVLLSQTDEPPVVNATGDQLYCTGASIPIVETFSIVDPDDTTVDKFFVQISEGYQINRDRIELVNTASFPDIVTTWNNTQGKLTIENSLGSIPLTDLVLIIESLEFTSTATVPTEVKKISLTAGDANYLPETDHYYEYVSSIGIRWDLARDEAATRTYFGLQGYLATITSIAEARLAGEQAAGAGWIGGSDEDQEGTWRWMTGPEEGTVFWQGGVNGATDNFAYWNTGEPNDLNNEDYVHVTSPGVGIAGSWNDLRLTGESFGDYQPKGYIVEYGGMPGDPVLQISASTILRTPSISEFSEDTICGAGTATLTAQQTSGEVVWFDSETSNTPVATGNTFTTPIIQEDTTYFVSATDGNGCYSNEREPVSIHVKQLPLIQQSLSIANCDEDGTPDGFIDFNLDEYNELIIANHEAYEISFYLTETDAEQKINRVASDSFNNSIANTVYYLVEGSGVYCHDIGLLNLTVSTTNLPAGFNFELETCDEDEPDGIYDFYLEDASAILLSQLPQNQDLTISYYINTEDAVLQNNPIDASQAFRNIIPNEDSVVVRVDDVTSGTCFGIGNNLLLKVYDRPDFLISDFYSFCTGSPVEIGSLGLSDDHDIEWMDASGNVLSVGSGFTVGQEGDYQVRAISNMTGCISDTKDFFVKESNPPVLTAQNVTVVEKGDFGTITIDPKILGDGIYEFSLDQNLFYSNIAVFDEVLPGIHTIYARDVLGCGESSFEVGIVGVPQFITPNADGNNDELKVLGLLPEYYQTARLYIYDRYGKLLNQSNPLSSSGWTGFFNGQLMPPSDYWYVLELVGQDGAFNRRTGHFTLKQ